jgi:phosphoribosyl-ATP pyrophosphohydrolase/phosphoribosyl-AMP cyclohydrolase
MIDQLNFEKMEGLIPAVIQHEKSGTVLMVGFMNQEALRRTLQEGRVTFWSRTRKKIWQKGETSGNYLNVVSMEADCDGDTLLIQALPTGAVCHTGAPSCFPSERDQAQLAKLETIIQERKSTMPEGSYTARLLEKGILKIAQKVGEEAVELALAAQYPDQKRCIEEAADLMYHVLILLAARDIPFSMVEEELAKRAAKLSSKAASDDPRQL